MSKLSKSRIFYSTDGTTIRTEPKSAVAYWVAMYFWRLFRARVSSVSYSAPYDCNGHEGDLKASGGVRINSYASTVATARLLDGQKIDVDVALCRQMRGEYEVPHKRCAVVEFITATADGDSRRRLVTRPRRLNIVKVMRRARKAFNH